MLDASLVSRVPSIGVIYSWTGVEQQTPLFGNYGHRVPRPRVEIVQGFVAIIPGANFPNVRLCAKSEKLAVRYARAYLDRFPETDRSAIDAWSDSLGAGYDAKSADGRTVQIKSTAGGHGAAFSWHEVGADHLIFLDLNFRNLVATVIYNGPERPVREALGNASWSGTRPLRRDVLVALDAQVVDRLPMLLR